MRNASLICGLFFASTVATLRAGSIVNLADGSETNGKLALNTTAIHVEGSSTSDLNLPDILEAKFSDAPFHLEYFSSIGDASSQLPAGWSEQEIGPAAVPGSFSYASGAFTLTSALWDPPKDSKDRTDHCFVAGRAWTGDGRWSFRIKSVESSNGGISGGFMVRASLDPMSAIIGVGLWDLGSGAMSARSATNSTWANRFGIDSLPVWFRMTRRGLSYSFESSTDGKQWTLIGTGGIGGIEVADTIWAGFYVNSHGGKAVHKITFDQVLFEPAQGPVPGEIVLPGVLLRSGSFVAGIFNPLDFLPDSPDRPGNFTRNPKNSFPIPPSKVTAAIYHPMKKSQITDIGAQVGILMRNGDFLSGNFEAINAGGTRINSVLLGTVTYGPDLAGACILNPLQPQQADYEIRLTDGSSIRASSLGMTNGRPDIGEISGITVSAAPEEIAQFRAGPSRVQTMIDLPWKTTPLPPTPAPTPPAVTKTNTAPATTAAPAATAAPAQPPPVECWIGPNQEQIMVVPAETIVDFPLTDKFRAMAMSVALSPDSPPGSQVTLRILVDGREIARTPAFKAGDQPRFMEATLQDPKTVTVVADSLFAGTKVLFIDPVAIRENVAPTP